MTPTIYPTGIYRGLPDAEYRAIPAVSQSTLKAFMKCPRKWKLSPKREATPNMIWGSYLDAMWLSGDLSPFAVMPDGLDGRTNAGKAWKAENTSKTIVTQDQHERATNAIERLNSIPEIKEAREACDVQVAVVAEIDGIAVKGLIDLCPRDGIRSGLADLKTAPSADPAEWGRYVFTNGLAIQAALYLDLWNRATGEDIGDFFHVIVEQEAPHEPAMIALSRDFIDLGRSQYRAALQRYRECEESGEWPGYPTGEVVDIEPWMLKGFRS
jgi:hypothetical protein